MFESGEMNTDSDSGSAGRWRRVRERLTKLEGTVPNLVMKLWRAKEKLRCLRRRYCRLKNRHPYRQLTLVVPSHTGVTSSFATVPILAASTESVSEYKRSKIAAQICARCYDNLEDLSEKIYERISAKSESQQNGKQELLKAFERLGKVLPEEDIRQLDGSMKSESQQNGKQELLKAFERLGKVLPEEDIRQLVGSMVQKNGADMHAKRLQDEADKEQNHQDKEVPALRKQLAFQKHASLMERFHKRSKNSSSTSHNGQFFNKSNIS
ncbi:LOW QUALITY PROTEIN: hypothetical protein LguiB_020368 [Lonicera macranthoides]